MNQRSRWILPVLISILIGAIISCGPNKLEPQSGKLQIAVIPKGTSNVYWQTVHAGALDAGKEMDVEILWQGPNEETNKDMQMSIIDDFIVQHVDGMVLAPQDAKVFVVPVERVVKAGIPVVIMDSGIQTDLYTSFAATDNYKGGAEAAHEMARRLNNKGKVIIIANDPGGESTNNREQGFQNTIKSDYPDIEIIGFEYHYNQRSEARAKMEDFLTRNPEMNGVFTSNESSTVGALLAIQASNAAGNIVFIGFDSSKEIVQALAAGEIEAIIHQDPYRIGYEGVKTMVKHLRGEPVEKMVDTGVYIVTKENMYDPDIDRLLNPKLDALED